METNITILCVDDEPAVLLTTELILKQGGYLVLTAANAREAIRLLRSQHIDLLLLDGIPDGESVIQEARQLNPSVRIAIVTGRLEGGESPLVNTVLRKPVAPPVLLAKIAELLHTDSSPESGTQAAA